MDRKKEIQKLLKFGDNNVPVVKFYDVNEPHVSAYLSQISKMTRNAALIWQEIFPRWGVAKKKNKIPVYGAEHLMRANLRRAPKTESALATRHLGTAIEYDCQPYAAHDLVGAEERANADPPIKAETDAAEFVTNIIDLMLEFEAYDLITTTTGYPSSSHYNTLSGGDQWSDFINSSPLEDIDTGKAQVWTASGKRANVILIPYTVALKLSRHPDVLEEKKYTDPNLLTLGGLPPVLKGLKVIEADAIYNTKIQGQTAVLSGLWSDYVWIGYVNPRMSLKDTTWGLTFDRGGRIARSWYEQKIKADWIEVEEQGIDMKIFDNTCGYLLIDTLA